MDTENGPNVDPRLQVRDRVVRMRRSRLEGDTGTDLTAVGTTLVTADDARGHTESFIGAVQVPVGVVGPVRVNGDHAHGDFFVPFATTEGTLVATYDYGMRAINGAGGATAFVGEERLDITAAFAADDLSASRRLAAWIETSFDDLSATVDETTQHGRLLEVHPMVVGRRVLAQFVFSTGDAMGMNLVNVATDAACRFIQQQTGAGYHLRCNYSSDKKASALGVCRTYGRETHAGVLLPDDVLGRTLGVTPEQFLDFTAAGTVGAIAAGVLGFNAHFANGLAAIYIACGQDVAQIVNASIGQVTVDRVDGGVYVALKLPNLVVGTVGGGTRLPTQRECLELMGCSGTGMVQVFAEVVAVALLAGEISIAAALANGTFVAAHERSRGLTTGPAPQPPTS